MVRLGREFPGEAVHRRRPLAHQEGSEPSGGLRVDGVGGAQAPDHKIHRHGHTPVTEGAVGPAHGLREGEKKLRFFSGVDPVRKDVALKPLHVAEADAPSSLDFIGEGLKRRVGHLLTPPRLLLDAGVVPPVTSTFAQHDFYRVPEGVTRSWNKLTDQPWLIMSIGLRDWAHRF